MNVKLMLRLSWSLIVVACVLFVAAIIMFCLKYVEVGFILLAIVCVLLPAGCAAHEWCFKNLFKK